MAFYQQAKDDGHNHVHVYLKRFRPYQAEGRYQSEAEALSVDDGVLKMLARLDVPVIHATPEEDDLKRVLKDILKGQ
jgi:hypothetical protein